MLGYGTIGRCSLPMLLDLFDLPLERITVVDAEDRTDLLAQQIDAGLTHLVRRITPDNLADEVKQFTAPGDLLLNLSVGVDSVELSDCCHLNGVIYVDTALEVWEEVITNFSQLPPAQRTEYEIHQRARKQAATRWRPDGPTAVVTHGANPGLVSHFTKAALLDIAESMGLEVTPPVGRDGWARLAQRTGTKVIHISERDTQISSVPKQPGEFVNTWSILGFVEEAMMPVEIGWGSHEKSLPPGGLEHSEGPRNAIYIPQPAAQFLIRSWVPLGGQIAGIAIPHNESVTISDYLTLSRNGEALYRPTVLFVYLACDAAMASLHETMMRDWEMQSKERIMNEDIIDGRDELGVLLLGHGLNGWWYGSQLDIHTARKVLPGHNPTAIQVAAGAVAATAWAAQNPNKGYCEPEDLPHDEVLRLAWPYLGQMVSQATDWSPIKDRAALFKEPWCDLEDPWQFPNFQIGWKV